MSDREWQEKHMLTVRQLVEHLKKFDQNALVMQFEVNTGDWQETSPSMLEQLVHTAKEEREDLMKRPQMFHEGKMEEEINGMLKYAKDSDVLVRF